MMSFACADIDYHPECGCSIKDVNEVKSAFQICDKKICTTTHIVVFKTLKP